MKSALDFDSLVLISTVKCLHLSIEQLEPDKNFKRFVDSEDDEKTSLKKRNTGGEISQQTCQNDDFKLPGIDVYFIKTLCTVSSSASVPIMIPITRSCFELLAKASIA